ncbi:MAG TPA: V-type ATP synthase subunit I [Methanocorpusculum sp.]|nr:V-type ATP synthase subunit I [Candidatus Methanocorpusculum equi]HJJ58185.1 V-type ATP synthase subunit I [Methanocorpusculum sp.]
MFQPKPMTRLVIAAGKDQMASVVSELYRHRVFHITDFVDQGKEGYEGVKIGTPMENAGELSTDLIKVRSIENVFQTSPKTQHDVPVQSANTIRAAIKKELPKISEEVNALTAKRSNAEAKIRECEQRIAELTPFALIPAELELYRGYETLSVFAGYLEHDIEFDFPCEKYFAPGKETGFLVLFAGKENAATAEKVLSDAGFTAVALPNETGTVQAALDKYNAELTAAKADAEEANTKVLEAKAKYADLLAACDEVLSCDVERAEAPLRFATTEETFVLEGWVPFDDVEKIKAALNQAAGGKIFVEVDEENINYEDVPVEYNNPGITKPGEVLLDLYARPKYRELDPTIILGIMFQILFGIIVGDVGYGLIYLIITLILRKFILRLGDMGKKIMGVMYGVSISTIVFGLIYSEFFTLSLWWHPLLFVRHLPIGEVHAPNIMDLLVLSVALGILYISVGRIFGMINHARMDHKGPHRTKAILSNLGWNFMLWGMLLAIFSLIDLNVVLAKANMLVWIPYIPGTAGTVTLIIAIVMFVAGLVFVVRENPLDLMELPSNLLSHMLSFSRIAAIGLSSVAIGMVVNYFARMFFGIAFDGGFTVLSIVLIIAAILLIIVGHAVNAVLGVLDGAINSIRLHFVEFFMKFYQGGGIIYKPFGHNRKFTEE